MDTLNVTSELRFFIALGLGFLIGLERESAGLVTKGRVFAGVRTYSLICVFGFGCAWLFSLNIIWVLPVGLLSVSAITLVGYLAKLKEGYIGWTSEVACLLTFITGALCLLSELWVPMALGIVATFLLSEKTRLEHYVEHLDKVEFLAVIKLLLVTLIILPILPDNEYTDFSLNPRHIWQIVIIVSSIGFAGYLLSKKFGEKIGLWLSGLLGGIVSSTAVSVAMGRAARVAPRRGYDALRASILAGSVMYLRILILIWIIKRELVPYIWLQLVALFAIGLVIAITTQKADIKTDKPPVKAPQNPFEIRPALIFAVLFVILSVVIKLIRQLYGGTGLMALAVVTGITDIDPFILSLASQATQFQNIIVYSIILSMMSNTVMKGIYFGSLVRELRYATFLRYGLWALLHLPIIFLS